MATLANLLEEIEILHIARPDLNHVSMAHHRVELLNAHHLGHHRQPMRLPGTLQQGQAIHPQPLK